MEIRVVNYEMVLESYQPYIDGVEKLESYKSDFTKKVESIKSEMEQIVSSSRLLVLDQSTKEKNSMRIRELQAEGMRLESEFRSTISEAQNKILEDCFKDIGRYLAGTVFPFASLVLACGCSFSQCYRDWETDRKSVV